MTDMPSRDPSSPSDRRKNPARKKTDRRKSADGPGGTQPADANLPDGDREDGEK
jgi:hypothetical protein